MARRLTTVYYDGMKSCETRSLIHDQPRLLDLPDYRQPAEDIRDICESLRQNLAELDSRTEHPSGNLELFETKFRESHLKGWKLRTNDAHDFDVALAASHTNTLILYAVMAWHYNPGAKCLFAQGNLQIQPRIRQHFLLLEKPQGEFAAADLYALENVGDAPYIGLEEDEEAEFEHITQDYGSFTIYSLYKLNRYTAVLRGDASVA